MKVVTGSATRRVAIGVLTAVLAVGFLTWPGSASTQGRVVTFAEQPQSPPTYILPLANGATYNGINILLFTENMYLPLYWFGDAGKPVLNKKLSVAYPPIASDGNTLLTIKLKHWNWSNGQPITARDVIFWLNLLSAVTDPSAPAVAGPTAGTAGPGWGPGVPGAFPANLVSYRQTGTYQLQLKTNAAYNPTWFLYNELSQVFPLPQASWDRLSATAAAGDFDASAEARTAVSDTNPSQYVPSDPGTATSGALGVAAFLNDQSYDLATYLTDPLWKVVDGPFRLADFTSSGFVKFVPNPAYSGAPKPTVTAFEEEPFTSDAAEFNAVRSGAVTIGYIPSQDIGQASLLEKHGYQLSAWNDFASNYMAYNFTNPQVGPIFRQLYFRKAFQSLVDQPEYLKDFLGGYGTVTNGPVPSFPAGNSDESPLEAKGLVYPYDPTKAVQLLKAHGWTVRPHGVTTCSRAGTGTGDCGAGIKASQALTFAIKYESGVTAIANEMAALESTVSSKAGITLKLSSGPFSDVVGIAFNGCSSSNPCSGWQVANWGSGWTYGPDYFPTGDEILQTGASFNPGGYSSSANDANISATETAPTQAAEKQALFRYEDYVAKELPLIWLPTAPFQITMYKSNLKGLVPQGIYSEIYPQSYALKR
ncbi:MAG: ABC transporter substrate-binding protein [Candidatus Dormiibacterota bacterium]